MQSQDYLRHSSQQRLFKCGPWAGSGSLSRNLSPPSVSCVAWASPTLSGLSVGEWVRCKAIWGRGAMMVLTSSLLTPLPFLLCTEDFSRRYLSTKDFSSQKKKKIISRFISSSNNQQAGLGSVSLLWSPVVIGFVYCFKGLEPVSEDLFSGGGLSNSFFFFLIYFLLQRTNAPKYNLLWDY